MFDIFTKLVPSSLISLIPNSLRLLIKNYTAAPNMDNHNLFSTKDCSCISCNNIYHANYSFIISMFLINIDNLIEFHFIKCQINYQLLVYNACRQCNYLNVFSEICKNSSASSKLCNTFFRKVNGGWQNWWWSFSAAWSLFLFVNFFCRK